MKNLKKDLQAVNKQLTAISKKIEKLIADAGKTEKPKAVKEKPSKKLVVKLRKKAPAGKKSKVPANLVVLGVIENSGQAVDIGTLKEKSGFQGQKLYNALYTLKKQGKITNPSKGTWVKGDPLKGIQ